MVAGPADNVAQVLPGQAKMVGFRVPPEVTANGRIGLRAVI
jgi:hypothetical protein